MIMFKFQIKKIKRVIPKVIQMMNKKNKLINKLIKDLMEINIWKNHLMIISLLLLSSIFKAKIRQ